MADAELALLGTLCAASIAAAASVITLFLNSRLTVNRERRLQLWQKELDRFFELEELAGRLTQQLGGHDSIENRGKELSQELEQLKIAAGRFRRYPEVREQILDLHNILMELLWLKQEKEDYRSTQHKLEPQYRKLLRACDGATKRPS